MESERGVVFLVMLQSIHHDKGNGTTSFSGIEISKDFPSWDVTFPTACDKSGKFQSPKDQAFIYRIYTTEYTIGKIYDLLPKKLKLPVTK